MTNSKIVLSACAILNKQEKLFVELLSRGFSSKQIAFQLSISQNTIDNHRKNMLKKPTPKM